MGNFSKKSSTPWIKHRVVSFEQDAPFITETPQENDLIEKIVKIKSIDPIRSYGFEIQIPRISNIFDEFTRNFVEQNVVAFKEFTYNPQIEVVLKNDGTTYQIVQAPTDKTFKLEFEDVYSEGRDSISYVFYTFLIAQIGKINEVLPQYLEKFEGGTNPLIGVRLTPLTVLDTDAFCIRKLDVAGNLVEVIKFSGVTVTNVVQSDLDYSSNSTSRITVTFQYEDLYIITDADARNYTANIINTETTYPPPLPLRVSQDSTIGEGDNNNTPTRIDTIDELDLKFPPNEFRIYDNLIGGLGPGGPVVGGVPKFKPKPSANTWQAKV
jgi:hypothetical protein